MNAVLLALAVLGGVDDIVRPRQVRIEVVVSEGDPLGSRADGNVKSLAEPNITTMSGRLGSFRVNSGRVTFQGADGKPQVVPTGVVVDVLPILHPNGKVWVDVTATRTKASEGLGIAGQPGLTERTVRHTRVAELGKPFRVRIAADGPDAQTWAEITVSEVPRK